MGQVPLLVPDEVRNYPYKLCGSNLPTRIFLQGSGNIFLRVTTDFTLSKPKGEFKDGRWIVGALSFVFTFMGLIFFPSGMSRTHILILVPHKGRWCCCC